MVMLEGETVRLRPLVPEEYRTAFDWYSDPEVVAPFDRFSTEAFEEFCRSLERSAEDPVSLAPRFGVERRLGRDLVGVVGYYRAHPVLESVDVWYLIGVQEARGHGVGREAVGLLVDHLLRSMTIERIGATCDVENVASIHLLERLGFRREGTMPSALYHHGRWHDVHVYGVTRADRAAAPRASPSREPPVGSGVGASSATAPISPVDRR
jgi:RimJ/RimL family protein N-acetyltransferase